MENSPGSDYNTDHSTLEFSDFFQLDEWMEDLDPALVVSGYPQIPVFALNQFNNAASGTGGSGGGSSHHEGPADRDIRSGQEHKKVKEKVAFKTKSDVEILDDGFKWRKYGKKMVKNSPNPRNYYRCSAEGCPVKKRVERDREDPRYVITTYEGVHNHQGPSNSKF
ncbi:hypothetical protein NMG60_11001734 [Bertholletia excelsa]